MILLLNRLTQQVRLVIKPNQITPFSSSRFRGRYNGEVVVLAAHLPKLTEKPVKTSSMSVNLPRQVGLQTKQHWFRAPVANLIDFHYYLKKTLLNDKGNHGKVSRHARKRESGVFFEQRILIFLTTASRLGLVVQLIYGLKT